ncbi:NAD(P)-binding protein [Suhomyces tanzawaensis NRRL Y-17324]|uniref:NAD(P)-binding protein n=1 Tax=Suhomyces tanzawaensis NRRL Y-17324 TaxID=984487 RepID=A0A1E4SPF6_9ASCO|nr:NAD(P)-binding protein [Suhomyces tanzawaensis NRRL Y-17324]ODV81272.1 NAD(P)-binding protein [Suhomyces tanzawaensis NRRL Y-17324]
MSVKSIAVFGGNGFLGRKICEVGVRLGYNVTAFSRSGKPPSNLPPINVPWINKVKWEAADLLDPSSYSSKLSQYDSVVHSVGMLFENQSYKKVANSNFNALRDAQNLANSLKGSNPMAKDSKLTFEAIQRDSAVLLADAFLEAKGPGLEPAFVYISASQKPPFVPERYLTTKREAEFELACKEGLRVIAMRCSFMTEEHSGPNPRSVLGGLVLLGHSVKQNTIGDSLSYVNNLIRPPVSTEQVARTLYEKLESGYSGIVRDEEIAKK